MVGAVQTTGVIYDEAGLIGRIRELHRDYTFCGNPRNALLALPDEQVSYILSLMRGRPVAAPKLTAGQWDALLEQMKINWVLPLLYSQMMLQPPESRPPDDVMRKLAGHYYGSMAEAVKAEYQLKEMLSAFQSAGIRALVLKGTAIAYSYYKSPALRPSSDMDILVRPEDVLRARSALEGLGYVCQEKRFDISRKLYNEEVFLHPSKRHYKIIEIHWNLFISCDVDLDRLFSSSIPVKHNDLSFQMLCPVDALIYNGLHLIMHHGGDVRLSWIYDTALLRRNLKTAVDMADLREKCIKYGATMSVKVTLDMAALWAGLEYPPGSENARQWPQPGKKERAALSHMYLVRSELMLNKVRFMWYCSSGLREKTSLVLFLLFPPVESMRLLFPGSPGWMLPVNYVRRLIRVSRKLLIDRGSARVDTN